MKYAADRQLRSNAAKLGPRPTSQATSTMEQKKVMNGKPSPKSGSSSSRIIVASAVMRTALP